MTKNEYNGWYNYETWVVNLWMDNERGSHDYWRERAREAMDEAKPQEARTYASQTQPERAKCVLADELKDQHEEALPELEGFAADLLNAAMSEVNWYEIAEHLIDELVEEAAVTKVERGNKMNNTVSNNIESSTSLKHTPGPWKIVPNPAQHGADIIGPDGFSIGAFDWNEPTEANAQLIAAAPDLLAICKKHIREIEAGSNYDLQDEFREAIAKAEGVRVKSVREVKSQVGNS